MRAISGATGMARARATATAFIFYIHKTELSGHTIFDGESREVSCQRQFTFTPREVVVESVWKRGDVPQKSLM